MLILAALQATVLSLTHAEYLFAGWTIGLVAIGLYALSVVARGRALTKQVPPERRRWMNADEPDSD